MTATQRDLLISQLTARRLKLQLLIIFNYAASRHRNFTENILPAVETFTETRRLQGRPGELFRELSSEFPQLGELENCFCVKMRNYERT